jgi:hypothetical protein
MSEVAEIEARTRVDPWFAAKYICEELKEPRPYKHHMLKHLCEIIHKIGMTRTIELTVEAQQLHAFKTILVKDGSRLKTLGGPALRKEPRSRKVDKCGTVFPLPYFPMAESISRRMSCICKPPRIG